jgi:hypothetical protein
MRFLIITSCLFMLHFSGKAQQNEKIPITSGVGIGEIKLGMSENDVLNLLKIPGKERSYAEQMKEFRKDTVGYSIENIAPFVIGFDKCIVYEGERPDNYPIFNLYFLNHKLNYVTLTAYGADSNFLSGFLLDKELLFCDPMDNCMDFLGCDYINLHYKDQEYDGCYLYYNRGLEVIYYKQNLLVICLFIPDKDLPLKMPGKRDQLIKEFRSIDPD